LAIRKIFQRVWTGSKSDRERIKRFLNMEGKMQKLRRLPRASSKLFIFIAFMLITIPSSSGGAENPANYPSKPITLIIHFSVGGTTDLTARKLADTASRILGQPIVAENKLGGAGVIGLNAVAKANPDGYTIGTFSYSASVIVPHLRSVPYNVKQDFSYILQYAEYPQAFCVLANARWKTFKEFIEDARKNPDKLNYATAGAKSGQHILMEQIALAENVKITHVPTQGGAEVVSQQLGGHVDGSFAAELAPHVLSGKVRALAVAGEKRLQSMPNIPTFAELGYKLESPLWLGLVTPKGVDPRIVKKLHDAFKKAYEDPPFGELCTTLVMTPIYRDSDAFKELVKRDFDAQAIIMKKLGFI
jgi:tripartite-type tricarboxylate transporter receptor subunit TctC